MRLQAEEPPFGTARRLGWAVLLAVLWGVFYFGAAALSEGRAPRSAALALDALIPCLPALTPLYLLGIVMPVLPAFLLPAERFFATWRAYAFAIAACALLFALLPVTTEALRAACPVPGRTLPALLRSIDPPVNAFPSLHVALAGLAALALRDQAVWGKLALAHALLQAMVVLLVKQHQLLDVVGGVAVAALANQLFIRKKATDSPPASQQAQHGP